jgi:hypothetical protein
VVYGTLKSNAGSCTSVVRTLVVGWSPSFQEIDDESYACHEDKHAEPAPASSAAGIQEARSMSEESPKTRTMFAMMMLADGE